MEKSDHNIVVIFVIYHVPTHRQYPYKFYKTQAGAKAALTKLQKRGALDSEYAVTSYANFAANDYEVEVINLMSGKPCKIRRSEVGGPCDPSTERYWSM